MKLLLLTCLAALQMFRPVLTQKQSGPQPAATSNKSEPDQDCAPRPAALSAALDGGPKVSVTGE